MTTTLAGLGKAAWSRLLQLDQPPPPRSDAELAAEVERNYSWNFTFNLLDGVAFWFGFNFISSSTVMPLFVSKLTSNPLLIGLIAVIAQSGWTLPQLFTAGHIERLARKKPVIVNLGLFLERMPVWVWPLAILAAPHSAPLALALFFLAYAWHAFGAGMLGPAWQDLLASCFPVKRRGRFFGTTTFLGTGAGAIGALFCSWLLEAFAFPLNFLYPFLIAAVAITLSWTFLAMVREPARPVTFTWHSTENFWQRLVGIVRRDHNFRRFLQARTLVALGTMGGGFVTVAAVQRWRVPDATVGLYTVALLVGQTAGNLLAGWLADHLGHKLSLEISAAAAGIGFALAWLAPAPFWYYAVFAFLGIANGASLVSGTLIAMEFSEPAQRPTYIGITNTAWGAAGSLAPLLGGWLAGFSYDWLFALSAGVMLLGLALLRWRVGDPRWHPRPVGDETVSGEVGAEG
jgi:MFS family permease